MELEKEIIALMHGAEILDAQEGKRYGKGKLGTDLLDQLRRPQERLWRIREDRWRLRWGPQQRRLGNDNRKPRKPGPRWGGTRCSGHVVTIRGLVPAASMCTPTPIGTTHRSTITYSSDGLPPSLKQLPRSRLALAMEDARQWWSGFW